MIALPQPRPDHSEPVATDPHQLESADPAIPARLADAISAAPDAPPPHLLWATLESAYATPNAATAGDERLAPYIALPMAIGLSLVLWVIIVELVLMR